MIEGLWTIEFGREDGSYGAGVVVCETLRVLGGDWMYFYVGDYVAHDQRIKMKVKVTRYNDTIPVEAQSIFGDLREFVIEAEGQIAPIMRLTGWLQSNPSERFAVLATKRSELP